ncbi:MULTISPECIES: M14 family metallopeptidase [unclassified Herbaspirillum]|uniref:M14 family metallopeptidase n=1 Tax=unclassified Herbaspirillum TaxID=2624150 RepID=UPI00114E9B24|nr:MULTISPECIES: M14 family metallopeptidase [unclassified Herbaspirillum]MBB5391023.1 putative deacylase [Herbaspirillum sp. SJZ102]TQK13277.1 succinylglutamate desuccinylase/aspartoacylase family protein [Herbaspirillum sp. SJZ130]TQK15281.1 succinylglutamate desuccinylase/aspartoacylase family protein [Herbaspirillum sp. SJZ106]TWC62590.1 succinylglutamate desuccinylase/aspartoacylase family protein [Herbaspirillum sp. SJZ099]
MKTLEQIRATLPQYPVEVQFPDIGRWRHGNTGVDYVHTFDSHMEGPHVMILALMHGNEVSGAIAVDRLLKQGLHPVRGRVTLGFGNVAAYARFNPQDADASRYIDEDMNRVWSAQRLDGDDDSSELRRARELRPVIDTVDFMLDLHSMHEAAPPLIVSGPLDKGMDFAAQLGTPQHVIVDHGHPNGVRMRDYAGFGDPASMKNALLVECGQHFSAASERVAQDVAARFLLATGAVERADVAHLMQQGELPAQRFIGVTEPVVAQGMELEFAADYRGMEVIPKAGTVIAKENEREITTPYDDCTLVMPSLRHIGSGVTVVRLGRDIAR